MNKICTDLSQSKKLVELGLDMNTADMWYPPSLIEYGVVNKWWENPTIIKDIEHSKFKKEYYIPCWSLSALLELMPQTIDKDDKWLLRLQRCYHRDVSRFICVYPNMKSTPICDNPLDAAFKMVCWLKENEKI